jgi:hypothetical protein
MAFTPPHRRRRWRRLALLPLAIAAALLAWFRQPLDAHAVTAASYGARIGCSCRFIAGRALGDCRKDFEPGMALVRLSEDTAAGSVTASFALFRHQTAFFRRGEGCVLEQWAD